MAKFGGTYQQYDSKTMAKVVGIYLPISPKDSREIARAIKGKSIDSAIKHLQNVVEKKQAVPFKRFNRDVPHRRGKGFGAGRFPKKASEHIIKLLKHLKANASDKALDAESMKIVHAAAQRGPVLWHYGRWRGRRRKCTYFEAVAEEIKKREKKIEKKIEERPKEVEEKPKEEKIEEVKVEKPKVEEKPEVKERPKEDKIEKPKLKSKPKKKPAKKKEIKKK